MGKPCDSQTDRSKIGVVARIQILRFRNLVSELLTAGAFSKSSGYGVWDSRVYCHRYYEAPWGNGWDRVAPARAPGFGVVVGMGQVGTIPR